MFFKLRKVHLLMSELYMTVAVSFGLTRYFMFHSCSIFVSKYSYLKKIKHYANITERGLVHAWVTFSGN